MTINYQLRPATMEDREFMMHLEKVNFEKFPKVMELFDEEHQKNQYENYFKPNHVCIIEYENRPIGAQSIIVRRKKIFIVYQYLLPEFHNKGIYESLINITLQQAKKQQKPVLTCYFKEDTKGKNIFENFGFEPLVEDDLRMRVKWEPSLAA